jgi:hypothetical protein
MKILTDRRMIGAVLALMSGLPAVSQAQDPGRIVGRVLDAQTAQPLVSVQVHVANASLGPMGSTGSLTALDGRYVIRDVPAGTYEVRAELIGYGTKTVTNVQVAPGETATLDVTLESQAIVLEEITVTSSAQRGTTTALMTERKLSVVVSDAIGAEQISRSPSTASTPTSAASGSATARPP